MLDHFKKCNNLLVDCRSSKTVLVMGSFKSLFWLLCKISESTFCSFPLSSIPSNT